ncbi:MAG: DNA polymerase IV [Clostridia bacterium]|nr:DNA polymerase IV [Clostridia bacterium]
MDRNILHIDINNCYASIECLFHPELAGKPVAVAGETEERHGIILAKNQIAKEYGVKTGEVIWQAKLKCPDLVTLKPHYDRYLAYSKAAHLIYERYTDRIEPFGIDECWLDVTCTRRDIKEVADEIRETVKKELGITVSVGASFNKIFAKLGSDMKKPDATTVITRENFREKVWCLPASDLLFVGRATTQKLLRHGVYTIGDLAKTPVGVLESWLGKWGEHLHIYANGLDQSVIPLFTDAKAPVKSVSNGTTSYRDLENDEDVRILTFALAESVASRLRKIGLKAGGVTITLKDSKFRCHSKQCKINVQSDDGRTIATTAFRLYKELFDWSEGVPIRSITIGAFNLYSKFSPVQLDFSTSPAIIKRRESLNSAIDTLRKRFGYTCINRAVVMGDEGFKSFDARLQNQIHPVGFSNAKKAGA